MDRGWRVAEVDSNTFDLVTSDGKRRTRFSLDRETAANRDDVELLGLDHPVMLEELGRWRNLLPEDLGIAVEGDGRLVVLTLWLVEASTTRGERGTAVQPIAVNREGVRVPGVERQAERHLLA
jgi:hypothetical protein